MIFQPHTIPAHEIVKFFGVHVGLLHKMVSQVTSYPALFERDKRFVLIYAKGKKGKKNKTATKFIKKATKPDQHASHGPHFAWSFGNFAFCPTLSFVKGVYGKALLVREMQINGVWQLTPM